MFCHSSMLNLPMILTTQEHSCAVDRLLEQFASSEYDQMITRVWQIRTGVQKRTADLLWLYVFAINTWDHQDGAFNYMTEQQMMHILSKSTILS